MMEVDAINTLKKGRELVSVMLRFGGGLTRSETDSIGAHACMQALEFGRRARLNAPRPSFRLGYEIAEFSAHFALGSNSGRHPALLIGHKGCATFNKKPSQI